MAGGHGTRARPFTEYFPKAMMPVNGRPVIGYVTDHLESFDVISDIVIVGDMAGLGAQIKNYYSGHAGKSVQFVQDSGMGTGGDLLHAPLAGESEFLLWFCDNLCALDVDAMLGQYRGKNAMACIATRSRRPEETGFAEVDDGVVVKFQEKPVLDLPYPECLGIYVLGAPVFDMILQKKGPVNLSYDILQNLPVGSIAAYDIGDAGWLDAESTAVLARNSGMVSSILSDMGAPSQRRQ